MEAPVSHIEIVDGKAVIKGRNIKVRMIAGMYVKGGATIEQVMEHYHLTHAEVHAALAYYYDNQEAFAQEERELQPLLDAAKQESEMRLEKLRAMGREIKGSS